MAEVRQRFPEQFDEVDIFEEVGIIGPSTILAHGVFLDHQQRGKLAKAGSSLVHCPTANLFRESGLMDFAAHRSPRVKIALGSGIGGGFEPFMPRVAADSLLTAKTIKVHSLPRRAGIGMNPSEAWWMLTAGGAAALGLEKQIGTIAPGYFADCLVVKPEKWIKDLAPELRTSALLYTLKPSQILEVYVAGKLVKKNPL